MNSGFKSALLIGSAIASIASSGAAWASDDQPVTDGTQTKAGMGEIVVTAQKRDQRLTDTPIPVTALSADSLASNGQVRVEDYVIKVPGVSLTSSSGANAGISIRGLASGGGNPTVGILIDDVAIGSSTSYGGGGNTFIPNLNPGDLQRVEVLRGPQGTLYGASSLGGLIKFVTKDPSTSRFSGNVEAGLNGVSHGSEVGYSLSGSLNLPASDQLALSASGYSRKDPGYVDNVITGERDINESTSFGGHFATLWRPSENINIKLGLLHQDDKLDGDPTLSRLNDNEFGQRLESRATRGTFRHSKLTLGTARISADFGSAQIDSITGYLVRDDSYRANLASSTTQVYFGADGGAIAGTSRMTKFSQEIRTTVPLQSRLSLMVGAYYGHEQNDRFELWTANDARTGVEVIGATPSGVPTNLVVGADWQTTATERALFTNLTWEVTDRLELQLGGRQSWNEQDYTETDFGPSIFNDPDTYVEPLSRSKDHPFVYLMAAKFKITPDLMTYARLATGYRAGGNNSVCQFLGVPCHFKPDTTQTMEIGLKGDIVDRLLYVDMSIYNINWRDIQLNTPVLDTLGNVVGVGFGNGSKARSRGVELALQSRPLGGVLISGWVVMNDAELTADLPTNTLGSGGYGVKGDSLPFSAKWSGNLSVDLETPVTDQITGRLGGSMSYVGQRLGIFGGSSTAVRYNLPSYTSFDVHAGLEYEDWALNIYCNNLSNEPGVINRGVGSVGQFVSVIRPRTFGVSLSKTF